MTDKSAWKVKARNENGKPICGIPRRKREGVCQNSPLENGRCRLHGGRSKGPPLGSQNNLKHGLYAKSLTREELKDLDSIEIGTIDREIRIARIHLNRVLLKEREYLDREAEERAKPGTPTASLDIIERVVSTGGGKGSHISEKRGRPDFHRMKQEWLGRIAHLERTRAEMLGKIAAPPAAPPIINIRFGGPEEQEQDEADALASEL